MKFEIHTNSKGEYYAITRNWLGLKSRIFSPLELKLKGIYDLDRQTETWRDIYNSKTIDHLEKRLMDFRDKEKIKGRWVKNYEVK